MVLSDNHQGAENIAEATFSTKVKNVGQPIKITEYQLIWGPFIANTVEFTDVANVDTVEFDVLDQVTFFKKENIKFRFLLELNQMIYDLLSVSVIRGWVLVSCAHHSAPTNCGREPS